MTSSNSNPLLVNSGYPPFDKIKPEHVEPGVQFALKNAAAQLEALEQDIQMSATELLHALSELSQPLEYAWGPVGHLIGVQNSKELRAAHEKVQPLMVAFGLRFSQSKPIYNALKNIRDGEEWAQLDQAQHRIVEKKIRDAEQAGVGLEGQEKERFNEIAERLSKHSTEFSNHVLDATKAFELILTEKSDTEGWPQSLKNLAAQSWHQKNASANAESTQKETPSSADNGPWRITLDPPCFLPFIQHSRNRQHREQLYRAFSTRASSGDLDNSELIAQILKLRKEKSQLLGFEHFADLSLHSKMAPSVEAVATMSEEIRAAAWGSATQDMEDLKSIAKAGGQNEDLAHWDLAFWGERLREQRFDYTDDQLRPYFPMPRVLDGLFEISKKLFGITISSADGQAPVWHKDVRFFNVSNEAGDTIAAFYLDPYSRPEEKRGGAWMDECLTRRPAPTGLQIPVAHLVCNGTPPVGDQPSLMSFREIETLFHEFGHGLQCMLTTVNYPDAAGINGVEWDAVEIASQFMENWCYHKPTLMGMTSHVETGEPLPEELFQKILAARTFRSGSLLLRQLSFGMTDMQLHSQHDPNGAASAIDVFQEVAKRTAILHPLPEDRFLCAFSHIFAGGYAAGYYSYLWSEVLSADAFSAFEEAGLGQAHEIAQIGRKFRDTILALGGSQHPMEVFKAFRGREPKTTALLKHKGLK